MPENFEPGILYFSEIYSVAVHLCACGCGNQVVTPTAGPNAWKFDPEWVTLLPSIGNFQLPCKSHYFIRRGKIVWA